MRLVASACLATLLASMMMSGAAEAQEPGSGAKARRWYKGNTHTHTVNTDGDSAPDDVARWYRERKYHFLVLSDHDVITSVDGLNALFAVGERTAEGRPGVPLNPFLLIPGEELTDSWSPRAAAAGRDLERKEVHLTALNVKKAVAPQKGASIAETIQRDVDAIRAAGGVPIVNHPNFVWSLTAGDLQGLRNVRLFELWNGHRQTHFLGGGGAPGVEALWDEVLSGGTLLYGVAADDAHFFRSSEGPAAMAAPGRGWVMVRAERLDAESILQALERGDFYATTGVELLEYAATEKGISLRVAAVSRSRYQVQFVGKGGRILKDVAVRPSLDASPAGGALVPRAESVSYEFRGDEGYVRARVIESNGAMAWAQPVMVPLR
jgi:hypothetical protein